MTGPESIVDVTAAYRLWDDLFAYCVKLALSTSDDSPEEKERARERFRRAQERSLKERDALWERILAARPADPRGGEDRRGR